ncbi:MAG: biopolymer transporter ExbD [Bacteroidales bacterium]|nr:biopolymer transporter ExbD [Bacteroidales bacterium]MCL2739396.1 biopolymer transporter ExbD [Bacteroidales bacterium]
MALKRTTKAEPSFSLASMTDVVFLLLIFFLITSTLVNPNALKLLLPKSTNQVTAKPEVSVSIKHYPELNRFTYHIDGNSIPVPFHEIEPALQQKLMNSEDPTIILYTDLTVTMEQAVMVMNIAKRNQYKILLGTAPE